MKTAFVFSGGGAKGAFSAGAAWAVMKFKGVKPDVMYGTSVGSINACGFSHLQPDEVLELWRSLKSNGDVLYPNGIQWLWNWWRIFSKTGLYSMKPLRKKITAVVNQFEPFIPAYSCFVNLNSEEPICSYVGNMDGNKQAYIDSVIKSSAIPLMMETCEDCVDGGVRDQTPLAKAIEDGCTDIHVFLTNPVHGRYIGPWTSKTKIFPWFGVLQRAVDDVMCNEIFISDLKYYLERGIPGVTLHVYAPVKKYIDTLDFNPEKIEVAIAAGIVVGSKS